MWSTAFGSLAASYCLKSVSLATPFDEEREERNKKAPAVAHGPERTSAAESCLHFAQTSLHSGCLPQQQDWEEKGAWTLVYKSWRYEDRMQTLLSMRSQVFEKS